MNIKGRVLAMVSACVVIFSQSSIATFALDNQEVLTLPTSVSDLTSAENMGQVVKIHNLHGADEGTDGEPNLYAGFPNLCHPLLCRRSREFHPHPLREKRTGYRAYRRTSEAPFPGRRPWPSCVPV